jgi:cysteinyl-tRNA synthetase
MFRESPFVWKFVAGVWEITWAFMIMWQKLNQSDGFSQNKVQTKHVNDIIEYINTIIRKTTTYTSTNQHISTLYVVII